MINKLSKKFRTKRKVFNNFSIFMNPHSYIFLYKDFDFYKSYKICNCICIDGIGLFFLLKIRNFFKKKKLPLRRFTGYDYFTNFLYNSINKKILLIGSLKTIKKLKKIISIENSSLEVITCGLPLVKNKFLKKDINKIIKTINAHKYIDECFVGIGAPKQEKLCKIIIEELSFRKKNIVAHFSGVGAVFDYMLKKRTMLFFSFRKIGLEWLFRLYLKPKKIWRRVIISLPKFFYLGIFNFYPNYYQLKLVSQFNKIVNSEKNFILSAFNLAFFAYLYKKKINVNKKSFYIWADGVFGSIFYKLKKIPGRKLIDNLIINSSIKIIHVIGTLSQNSHLYLIKKFKKQIKHNDLPYGSIKSIINKLPKINKKELVFITLPSPKQEIVANYLTKKNSNYKIICIGGGLGIASNDEKPCPSIIEKLNLEFVWRLKYQTRRRIARLVYTSYIAIIAFTNNFISRVDIREQK